MAELKKTLDRIAAGEVTAEEVAGRVGEIVRANSRQPAEDWLERERRAWEDDYDFTDTFSEVEAARLSGRITEEQYATLRRAVVGGEG